MSLLRLKKLISRSVRILMTVLVCSMLLLSNAFPAYAYGTSKDNPIQDDEFMQKTTEMLRTGPSSLKTTQERAKKGPNEVQADAGMDEMISPEDARNVVTPEEKIGNVLKKIAPNK
jgi:hypothetical protein